MTFSRFWEFSFQKLEKVFLAKGFLRLRLPVLGFIFSLCYKLYLIHISKNMPYPPDPYPTHPNHIYIYHSPSVSPPTIHIHHSPTISPTPIHIYHSQSYDPYPIHILQCPIISPTPHPYPSLPSVSTTLHLHSLSDQYHPWPHQYGPFPTPYHGRQRGSKHPL